jgi:hypothetical protein
MMKGLVASKWGQDAFVRVGSVLQKEADHFGKVAEDSVVQGGVAFIRERELGEFGSELQHGSRLCDVTAADGIAQPLERDAVHVGFEFRPALESIGSCKDELSVMERESRRVRVVVVGVDFRGRRWFVGEESGERFLGLAAELV